MIMRLKDTPLAIALVVLAASVAYPQPPQPNRGRDIPDFSVQVWSDVVTDFSTRVLSYVALRTELERGLPALTVTGDPAETRRTKQLLAKRIREARAKARQGDIFTATISVEFRKALVPEINAETWTAIMDDNPGEFPARVNGIYPEGKPFSTVPSGILAVLPSLPDDIEYRLLGRHLVLLDTRATLILDRIPYVIQCTGGIRPVVGESRHRNWSRCD